MRWARCVGLWVTAAMCWMGNSAWASGTVYTESATTKVRPDSAVGSATSVSLVAARNEFVSFQVVVNGGADGAHNVRATFTGLAGPTFFSFPDITLYRVEWLDIANVTPPNTSTGLWPDALIPDVDELASEKRGAFPFEVSAHQARSIWVDIHVPATASPGVYQGKVSVSGDGLSVDVPVSLRVATATLPSTSSLASAFLISLDAVCRAHGLGSYYPCGAAGEALVQKYQSMALDHRFTLTNVFTAGSMGDWTAFDKSYGPFLDGTASTHLAGARMTTAQCPHPNNDDASAAATTCASFAQHFTSKGWGDKVFDYTRDEPSGKTITDGGTDYADAVYRANLVHKANPKIRTLITTSYQDANANGLLNSFDLLVPVVNWMYGKDAPYAGDQRAVYDGFIGNPQHGVWMYQSCMSQGCGVGASAPENKVGSAWPSYMVDASAARNRAMQWVDFRERISAELYYDTAFSLDTAWTNQFPPEFNGNGDGNIFYPGTPAAVNGQKAIGGSTHIPVASIRMKMIRQGMQDYEWLKLVSDAGDPNFAKATAAAVFPSPYQIGDDGAVFDSARAALITRYVQLHPALGPEDELPLNGVTPSSHGKSMSLVMATATCSAAPGSFGAGALFVLGGAAFWRRRRSR